MNRRLFLRSLVGVVVLPTLPAITMKSGFRIVGVVSGRFTATPDLHTQFLQNVT